MNNSSVHNYKEKNRLRKELSFSFLFAIERDPRTDNERTTGTAEPEGIVRVKIDRAQDNGARMHCPRKCARLAKRANRKSMEEKVRLKNCCAIR